MKTITVLNEKGGVGKTTVAVTGAAGLAARGWRVLLIDADAQGHATRGVGLAKYPGLYDLIVRHADYKDVIKGIPTELHGGTGRLAVLGSNVETRNIANLISDAWALAEHLEPLADVFDVVIIDTAPTPSLLHGAIYLATDVIIYPTLLEYWSFDGLAESIHHQRVIRDRKQVAVGGILPMRYRKTTLEHQSNLELLREQFGDLVWEPVPERIIWAEAASAQKPVFVHAAGTESAGHAWEVVDRLESVLNV